MHRRPVRSYVRWRALATARNCPYSQRPRSKALGALGSNGMTFFKVAGVVTLLAGALYYLSDAATERRRQAELARMRAQRARRRYYVEEW